jgi:hypothetical protein
MLSKIRYKGLGRDLGVTSGMGLPSARQLLLQLDLVVICWLVESTKANVIEFEQEQDLQTQSSCVVQ